MAISKDMETLESSYISEDWGLIDYKTALKRQEDWVERLSKTAGDDIPKGVLVFCTHPPLVTLGRATQAGDVFAWSGQVEEISRGGRATYHGPSQLVVYPIINLNEATPQRRARDIGQFLRNFESAIINSLKEFGISAQGRSLQKKAGEEVPMEETGVWVEGHKIASLGLAIRHWVTYHGAAINLDKDEAAFQGMKPCGFSPSTMISAEEILGRKIDRAQFAMILEKELRQLI